MGPAAPFLQRPRLLPTCSPCTLFMRSYLRASAPFQYLEALLPARQEDARVLQEGDLRRGEAAALGSARARSVVLRRRRRRKATKRGRNLLPPPPPFLLCCCFRWPRSRRCESTSARERGRRTCRRGWTARSLSVEEEVGGGGAEGVRRRGGAAASSGRRVFFPFFSLGFFFLFLLNDDDGKRRGHRCAVRGHPSLARRRRRRRRRRRGRRRRRTSERSRGAALAVAHARGRGRRGAFVFFRLSTSKATVSPRLSSPRFLAFAADDASLVARRGARALPRPDGLLRADLRGRRRGPGLRGAFLRLGVVAAPPRKSPRRRALLLLLRARRRRLPPPRRPRRRPPPRAPAPSPRPIWARSSSSSLSRWPTESPTLWGRPRCNFYLTRSTPPRRAPRSPSHFGGELFLLLFFSVCSPVRFPFRLRPDGTSVPSPP